MTNLFVLLGFFFVQIGTQNRAPVPVTPSPMKFAGSAAVDHTFALAALQGNNAEIDLANLALQHGHASEVLGFAKKMIYEHDPLMKEFQPVIARLLPSGAPQRLSPTDTLISQHLESLPAADFDQEYLAGQVAAHVLTLTIFQTEADNGTDPEMKALARKWLPTIQSHLELAVDLTKHIGGSSPFKP
jgi:putative membrane protein